MRKIFNSTVTSGDPVAELEQLKQAPGKDNVQYGSGRLSFTMLKRGCPTATFDLVDTKALANGIAILSYRHARTYAASSS